MVRWLFLSLAAAAPLYGNPLSGIYQVGAGIADITGPPYGAVMQGYVRLGQKTEGIHTRLRSRAFVIAEGSGRRVALVTADLCFIPQGVKLEVLRRLAGPLPDLYRADNVLIAATHTHSGPGGYSHHHLYNLGSGGYSPANFRAIVEGITESLLLAHDNVAPARIRLAQGRLEGASRNRSPEAYALNPQAERERYGEDVDRQVTLLRFERPDGTPLGLLSWFAVHAVSLQGTNHLIDADNKGLAAQLFEKEKGADYRARRPFVAAFANSNAGDVSPNTAGDLNGDGNWDCPLATGVLCARDSARRHLESARALFEGARKPLFGPVDYRHTFVDFSAVTVDPAFTGSGPRRTCFGAIGLSMLAGTVDGPGVGRQGVTCLNIPLWQSFLCGRDPTGCHGVKPLAILTGLRSPPWSPQILPLQIVRIGELALAGVPAEFTTMAGRRTRERLLAGLRAAGVKTVVLAGYANAYSGYVATPEEYQGQYYEGASTHFGPWTLPAYLQELSRLADALAAGEAVPPGPAPLDLSGDVSAAETPAPADVVPLGKGFGEVIADAAETYRRGETVEVRFWGASPNHDFRRGDSFLRVERKTDGGWTTVAEDWDFETRVRWSPRGPSRWEVIGEWDVPLETPAGQYRLVHASVRRARGRGLVPYRGESRPFKVD